MLPNVNDCSSWQSCVGLLKNIQNTTEYLNNIKYIAHQLRIDYLPFFYPANYDCDHLMEKASNFGDVLGYRYVFNKCNKKFPEDFYNEIAYVNLTEALHEATKLGGGKRR